ncbi:hypothetical protein D3C84_669090 [compost metagenome]
MHQVGFTQTDAAIKEERVVTMLRVVRHLPGCGPGQLVGLAFDEVLKGKSAIQVAGVLERTLNLHRALFRTDRGLLRARTSHRVKAVTGRFFLGNLNDFRRGALRRSSGSGRWRIGRCLGLGSGSSQGRVGRCTRCRTTFAAY